MRDTERDKVVLPEAFRPGDVVRARVISLGDARSYMLSTAALDLGVVYAESEAGARVHTHAHVGAPRGRVLTADGGTGGQGTHWCRAAGAKWSARKRASRHATAGPTFFFA